MSSVSSLVGEAVLLEDGRIGIVRYESDATTADRLVGLQIRIANGDNRMGDTNCDGQIDGEQMFIAPNGTAAFIEYSAIRHIYSPTELLDMIVSLQSPLNKPTPIVFPSLSTPNKESSSQAMKGLETQLSTLQKISSSMEERSGGDLRMGSNGERSPATYLIPQLNVSYDMGSDSDSAPVSECGGDELRRDSIGDALFMFDESSPCADKNDRSCQQLCLSLSGHSTNPGSSSMDYSPMSDMNAFGDDDDEAHDNDLPTLGIFISSQSCVFSSNSNSVSNTPSLHPLSLSQTLSQSSIVDIEEKDCNDDYDQCDTSVDINKFGDFLAQMGGNMKEELFLDCWLSVVDNNDSSDCINGIGMMTAVELLLQYYCANQLALKDLPTLDFTAIATGLVQNMLSATLSDNGMDWESPQFSFGQFWNVANLI